MDTIAESFSLPLIKTKLSAPQLRAGLVARPQLLDQLKKSSDIPFILICAPAGYGKTTLLSNWITDLKRNTKGECPVVCWLSLGEGDNEPTRFLSYMVASFETAGLDISAEAYAMLQASPPPPIQTVLAVLINDLEKFGTSIFLILDDYQFISNRAVHEGMILFLDNLPANLHLVIATRSDPPIPLAKLRARGKMEEIRAIDLRFSVAETDCLFNQMMGLRLTQEDIFRLEERTEGWIVGLQMASLALKGIPQSDYPKISAFVKNFSGSNRYILDYLVEEVLNHQPPEIQDFLLKTSILENLSGPLCDAVTGIPGLRSAGEIRTGQQILEYLDRSNLFLVALDSERQWYRYHHLFASLLRSRLRQAQDPATISELHRRAGEWYESKALFAEAISQALSSPDLSYAGEILEKNILAFFYQSEITQVHQWLELLPENLIIRRPLLCAVHAAAIALLPPYPTKSLAIAEKWIQAAEATLSNASKDDDLVRAFIYNIRSYWAYFRAEVPEVVLQSIANALSFLPADARIPMTQNQLFIYSALQTLTGLSYWAAGNNDMAEQTFLKARQINRACNDFFNESASVVYLVQLIILKGYLEEAASLCRESLSTWEHQKGPLGHRTPHSAYAGIQLAEILMDQNKLDEVEPLLIENMQIAKWTVSHDVFLRGYIDLARLAVRQGNPASAFNYLNEAENVSDVGACRAGAQRATFWILLSSDNPGYIDLARGWAQNYSLVEFGQGPPQMEWVVSIALGHVYLAEAEGNPVGRTNTTPPHLLELLEWLERQKRAMHDRGWVHWEIQLCLLECLTHQAKGNMPFALKALRHALELGAPSENIGVFIEEGDRLRKVLIELEKEGGELLPYLRKIVSAFPDTPNRPVTQIVAGEGLVERLTAREVEILLAMAEGLSNQQIADRFFLAEGTVKFYVHAVLEKLGVHNRTQAVIEAKKLEII